MAHEVLVDLFKNRPSLGAELLSEALGVELPSYSEARLVSIDLTKIKPAEYRADVVVLLLQGEVPIAVLIVEVQLGIGRIGDRLRDLAQDRMPGTHDGKTRHGCNMASRRGRVNPRCRRRGLPKSRRLCYAVGPFCAL